MKLIALAAVAALAGGEAGAGTAKPSLRAVDLEPLTVRGSGFKQHERVKLLVSLPEHASSRLVRASAGGRFRVVFRANVGRCDGAVVQARGFRGSRATLQLDALHCISP